jgi:alkylation response protein AidB-like acyl-CoA dehydrogenase
VRADCRELLHPHGERGRLTGRLSCGYEYKEALKGDLAASSGAARRTQRNHVLPEDIRNLAHRLLRHRLILHFEAISAGVTPENVIDAVLHEQFVLLNETRRKAIDPRKDQVRRKGLWATHLGPELGGQGYGQLKLALLNEILGRSAWAPIVFGCQAPDTGNAEIIAHYGTDEQKERYLRPVLDGEMFSS